MAGVQDSALTLAASKAGALGSLPAAMLSLEKLQEEISILTASGLPYNVNFFCHENLAYTKTDHEKWVRELHPYYEEFDVSSPEYSSKSLRSPFSEQMAELVEQFCPPVVSFHFGLPSQKLLQSVKNCGALVISSATTVREARWLEDNGADAVIAQGLEAGGHRGHFLDKSLEFQTGTLELVRATQEHLTVPIIAAGGISSAADVKHFLALGVAAVQVGTAFLLASEAQTNREHRALLLDPHEQTEITNVFSGGLARGIHNRAMDELGPLSASAPPFPHASTALAPLRNAAEEIHSPDFSPLWSGTNRATIFEGSAEEIIRNLMAQ